MKQEVHDCASLDEMKWFPKSAKSKSTYQCKDLIIVVKVCRRKTCHKLLVDSIDHNNTICSGFKFLCMEKMNFAIK